MGKQKQLRAALYSRYSTDKQSSTAPQIQVCKDICRREGFRVVAEYSDEEISGGTSKRPQYQRMMEAARAKAFDVIVSEDSSRLWRNMAHQWPALKELQDLGIHVIGHGGLDTRREDSTISLAVQGATADAYRAEIGRRTKRTMMEKARNGEFTGGRAYGYRIKNGKRHIEEHEAKIVRRIYSERASGRSALSIVRRLNDEKVPPPGEHWNRKSDTAPVWRTSAVAGDPKRGIGILNNPLYRGEVVYNRFHWQRGAMESDRRKPILLPREQWVVHRHRELRIVDERTWLTVQRLQTEESPKRLAIRNGIKKSPWKARPKWWLSGVLACDVCKSNLVLTGQVYVCPTARVGRCKHRVRIKKTVVEGQVLELLREHLLDRERMRGEIRRVEAMLKNREAEEAHEARRAIDGTELRRIEKEMRDVAKLRISAAAKEAALAALRAERETLMATAKTGPNGVGMARKLLARLPDFAKDYERLLSAALLEEASQDAIEDARNATAQLIEGGRVFFRAGKEATQARVELLGLGAFVLRVAKPGATAHSSGSGGRI